MAWRRHREPARFEPPAWWRVFDPAMWDEPDALELRMLCGHPPEDAPELHEIHARRRWGAARYQFQREHPAFAEQLLEDLLREARERDY